MNLKAHHPSWNTAATALLVKQIKNMRRWKRSNIKLILNTADIPKQASFPSGQWINLIQLLKMSLAVNSKVNEIMIQKMENTT